MQGNVIITNRDFCKVVFKNKTVILGSYFKEALVQVNFYRKTRLVTRSTFTIRLVTCSTGLTTRSTGSTRLPTRSTGLTTRSTCLSSHSAHLFIRSTPLSTGTICLSTCSTRSTICLSFDDLF